jgi:hypothetical protein
MMEIRRPEKNRISHTPCAISGSKAANLLVFLLTGQENNRYFYPSLFGGLVRAIRYPHLVFRRM